MKRRNTENKRTKFNIKPISSFNKEKENFGKKEIKKRRILKVDNISKELLQNAQIDFDFDDELVDKLFSIKESYKDVTKKSV